MLELGDLWEGVTYLVRVSALVGSREGSAAALSIHVSKCTWLTPALDCGDRSGCPHADVPVPLGMQSSRRWAVSRSCG